MSTFARDLQAEHGDVWSTINAILVGARREIPGTEHAGVRLLIKKSTPEPEPSESVATVLIKLESELKDGPSFTCADTRTAVRIDDTRSDARWPRFAATAAEIGVGSLLCVPLIIGDSVLGSLNLFAGAPNAFSATAERIAAIAATHAAVALSATQVEANLNIALDTRDVIAQAKGIVMERYKLTPDRAFGVLVRCSQNTHRKLQDVAAEIADTGVIPAAPEG